MVQKLIGPRLVDLDAVFVRHEVRDGREVHVRVEGITGAQGVSFRCPRCEFHKLCVWFDGRGVPETATPAPRWTMRGTSLADLSLAPSINFGAGCWHGNITHGWTSHAPPEP